MSARPMGLSSRRVRKPYEVIHLTEKHVERQCDRLVIQISGKGGVVRFSQARASRQTPGISDRIYRVYGLSFWFEVKPPKGRLTRDQSVFLEAQRGAGQLICCGGVDELKAMLIACRKSAQEAMLVGSQIVADWSSKGFRNERKTVVSPSPSSPSGA